MSISKFTALTLTSFLLAGTLAACAPQEEEASPAGETEQNEAGEEIAGDTEAEATAEYEEVSMPSMALTAWRVLGEDGAIYTTMFDGDGTYRDFKNGDALQSGSWEERNDGKLCFAPADEDRIGECWEIGMMAGEDTMRVTGDAGKTIELKKVTYIAPAEEG